MTDNQIKSLLRDGIIQLVFSNNSVAVATLGALVAKKTVHAANITALNTASAIQLYNSTGIRADKVSVRASLSGKLIKIANACVMIGEGTVPVDGTLIAAMTFTLRDLDLLEELPFANTADDILDAGNANDVELAANYLVDAAFLLDVAGLIAIYRTFIPKTGVAAGVKETATDDIADLTKKNKKLVVDMTKLMKDNFGGSFLSEFMLAAKMPRVLPQTKVEGLVSLGGFPLKDAIVRVIGFPANKTVFTGANGLFSIPVKRGVYVLEAIVRGCERRAIGGVMVDGLGKVVTVDFVMVAKQVKGTVNAFNKSTNVGMKVHVSDAAQGYEVDTNDAGVKEEMVDAHQHAVVTFSRDNFESVSVPVDIGEEDFTITVKLMPL